MGLHENILTALQSVIRCKPQQVLDEEKLSDAIKQKTEVVQGDKLSSLFLSHFIAVLCYKFNRDG